MLTLALVFSILTCAPFAVSAAQTDGLAAVAASSDEPFGDRYNGRYTLESETYQLTADYEARGYLYVPSGVEAAIDLNGHTIIRALADGAATGVVIKNNGTLTITDSSGDDSGMITGGYAERGGAVDNYGTLIVDGGTIRYNKATFEGGAVMNNAGATLIVNGGVFKNNESLTYGGGAFVNKGTMTLAGGAVVNNTAKMDGGGIFAKVALTMTDCNVSGIHLSIGTGSNKVTYNAKNYDDLYAYVEVEEIPAFELNNAYTLSVGDKDLGSYSALTYVKDVLTNDASDDALINTVTAMYRYHKEAVAYFSNYIG